MYNTPDKASEILQDVQQIASSWGTFSSHCEEIALRVMPVYAGTFSTLSNNRPAGEKKNQEMYDATGAIALGRFGSILDSLLTPRNAIWQRLINMDPKLSKNREAKIYFEEVTRLLFKYRYNPNANFTSQNQSVYRSLGGFGNGVMFIDEARTRPGLRYKSIPLGECFFRQNHQGIVDTLFRYYGQTAREAYSEWGNALPDGVLNKLATSPDSIVYFCHVVRPRKDYDPERLDAKGMAFESCYVSVEGKKVLSEGGFTTFPYTVPRYEVDAGEVTGRSPAMFALPAIKTLNEQKKTLLKQGHRIVDPVLLTHDDGVVDTFSLRPGAVNAGGVSADGKPLVHALPTGNLAVGKEMMAEEKAIINDAFLVSLFQILTENPQMTATEVLERTREKGILMNPTLGRVESEHLGPLTERELDVLAKQGLLPPMPRILQEAQGEYQSQYESPLARAAKAEEASGLMRSVETALNIVNVTQNQEPLDHFNWDVIIPEISNIQGVPEKWMRSIEDVSAIREGRAEAAQAQQKIQAAPAAAAMMKAEALSRKAR